MNIILFALFRFLFSELSSRYDFRGNHRQAEFLKEWASSKGTAFLRSELVGFARNLMIESPRSLVVTVTPAGEERPVPGRDDSHMSSIL
jgi:hypothetical protein